MAQQWAGGVRGLKMKNCRTSEPTAGVKNEKFIKKNSTIAPPLLSDFGLVFFMLLSYSSLSICDKMKNSPFFIHRWLPASTRNHHRHRMGAEEAKWSREKQKKKLLWKIFHLSSQERKKGKRAAARKKNWKNSLFGGCGGRKIWILIEIICIFLESFHSSPNRSRAATEQRRRRTMAWWRENICDIFLIIKILMKLKKKYDETSIEFLSESLVCATATPPHEWNFMLIIINSPPTRSRPTWHGGKRQIWWKKSFKVVKKINQLSRVGPASCKQKFHFISRNTSTSTSEISARESSHPWTRWKQTRSSFTTEKNQPSVCRLHFKVVKRLNSLPSKVVGLSCRGRLAVCFVCLSESENVNALKNRAKHT